MEFKARIPKEGINVTEEHPLKEASILIVGLTMVFAAIAVLLIFFVDLVVPLIPAKAEAETLGAWIPDDIDLLEGEDQVVLQQLVDRLAEHWPENPYNFRIGVFDGGAPNALALPGGLILVTSELLDELESENELALVLGHEIGHYRNRDHLRMLGRGVVLSLLMTVALGNGNGLDLGNHVSELALNTFGREQESQADRFGLSLVHAEYGHVNGSWRFFERLAEQESEADRLASYLTTHPASANRSDEIKDLASSQGWSIIGPLTPWEGD